MRKIDIPGWIPFKKYDWSREEFYRKYVGGIWNRENYDKELASIKQIKDMESELRKARYKLKKLKEKTPEKKNSIEIYESVIEYMSYILSLEKKRIKVLKNIEKKENIYWKTFDKREERKAKLAVRRAIVRYYELGNVGGTIAWEVWWE